MGSEKISSCLQSMHSYVFEDCWAVSWHSRTNFTPAVHCCCSPHCRVKKHSPAITFDRNGNQIYSPSAAAQLNVCFAFLSRNHPRCFMSGVIIMTRLLT